MYKIIIVPSASSVSSLKFATADRLLRVLYQICILYLFLLQPVEEKEVLEYEKFDLRSLFMRVFPAAR